MIDDDDYAMAKSQCSILDCGSWRPDPELAWRRRIFDNRPGTLDLGPWTLDLDLDLDLELGAWRLRPFWSSPESRPRLTHEEGGR